MNFATFTYRAILFFFFVSTEVESLSSGAPQDACKDMKTQHGTQLKTNSPSIDVKPSTIKKTDVVTVTIKVKPGSSDKFKGYMIQAKPTSSSNKIAEKAIGTFKPAEGVKRMKCFDLESSSVTHEKAADFKEVQVQWIPPSNFTGKITFVATVVKKYDEYWMGIESAPVTVQ